MLKSNSIHDHHNKLVSNHAPPQVCLLGSILLIYKIRMKKAGICHLIKLSIKPHFIDVEQYVNGMVIAVLLFSDLDTCSLRECIIGSKKNWCNLCYDVLW